MRHKSGEKMKDILSFVNAFYAEQGQSPTVREIAEQIGLSPSNVLAYLQEMNEKGMLSYQGGRRGIRTPSMRHRGVVRIPLVGDIACGTPLLAEENIECYLTISSLLLCLEPCFALRAKGNSMINIGIEDGDIVIVRKQQTAEEGQVVVALVNGEETTLKRFYLDVPNHRVRLHPENDQMEDLYYEDVVIQGVVLKVIKDVR